jgi:predicted nucleic acid-binding Zn ribbon protein
MSVKSDHAVPSGTATCCSLCGHRFVEGETVFRKREWVGPSDGMHWALLSLCAGCVQNLWHASWWDCRGEPVPCAGGCGLWVYDWYDRHKTCSTHCTERAARERKRAKPRSCAVCGEWFTPTRCDQRFCSPTCRVRAYRRRLKERA